MDEPEEHVAQNRYYDRTHEIDAVKLLPGEYYVTDSDMVLVTVLGSCVAACVRDPKLKLGGMNHFMLPGVPGGDEPGGAAGRYGVQAMELLLNRLFKRGAKRDRLEAKVFGGGNVLSQFTTNTVGERNANFILDFLETEGIALAAQDLLDVWPRKVYYFPDSGKVLVKKLKELHNETLLERERDYNARIARATGGDVELFG